MPRGDMGGDVLFTDRTHKLCCQMQFGKVHHYPPLKQRRTASQVHFASSCCCAGFVACHCLLYSLHIWQPAITVKICQNWQLVKSLLLCWCARWMAASRRCCSGPTPSAAPSSGCRQASGTGTRSPACAFSIPSYVSVACAIHTPAGAAAKGLECATPIPAAAHHGY